MAANSRAEFGAALLNSLAWKENMLQNTSRGLEPLQRTDWPSFGGTLCCPCFLWRPEVTQSGHALCRAAAFGGGYGTRGEGGSSPADRKA